LTSENIKLEEKKKNLNKQVKDLNNANGVLEATVVGHAGEMTILKSEKNAALTDHDEKIAILKADHDEQIANYKNLMEKQKNEAMEKKTENEKLTTTAQQTQTFEDVSLKEENVSNIAKITDFDDMCTDAERSKFENEIRRLNEEKNKHDRSDEQIGNRKQKTR
jgi:hypothetical protein